MIIGHQIPTTVFFPWHQINLLFRVRIGERFKGPHSFAHVHCWGFSRQATSQSVDQTVIDGNQEGGMALSLLAEKRRPPPPSASAVVYTKDYTGPHPTTGWSLILMLQNQSCWCCIFLCWLWVFFPVGVYKEEGRVVQSASVALILPRSTRDPLTVVPLPITEEVIPPVSRNICELLHTHEHASEMCSGQTQHAQHLSINTPPQSTPRTHTSLVLNERSLNIITSEVSQSADYVSSTDCMNIIISINVSVYNIQTFTANA